VVVSTMSTRVRWLPRWSCGKVVPALRAVALSYRSSPGSVDFTDAGLIRSPRGSGGARVEEVGMRLPTMKPTRKLAYGALTFAALFSLVLPALAAAPKKGGTYRGTVAGSAGQPVALYVSKTGRRFRYPSGATLVMQCSTGHPLRVSPNPLGVDIKNGKFSFKATDKENGPRPNTVTMTGKFSDDGKKVSGTISYEGADDQWGTCKTGTLKYTAKLGAARPSGGR